MRIIFIIRVTCVMLFRIACRGGIINTAHAIRRHILDHSHPAFIAFVPDLHFWGIDESGGSGIVGTPEKGFLAVAYSSHRNTAALVHCQLFIGHLSAIGGNIHRAIAGNRSNALKGILTIARHRNITAGVIHGQAAVHCDSTRIAYVHTAACRNVGALCNCGLRCINRISGHGNGTAGVYGQFSAHSCALRVGDRHCAIAGDVGVTDDRCIVSACTDHLNAAAMGHDQAALNSRAHKCSPARKKSKFILDLYRTIAGDHGIAACIIAKRIQMAACDRHAAIASGIVYIQAAQHHPVILGRQRDFAGAVHNLQRPKEPNAGTCCRFDRYIFHAGNGQADITGTACVSHPVRSGRAQHKILSSANKGDPFQFLRMLSTSHCNGYRISVICNAVTGQKRSDVVACDGSRVSTGFLNPDKRAICRQCRCAHAQHHAQRHKGREQPLGQGRLLHTEFLLFAYGGGVCVRLKNTIFHLLFQ